MTLPSGSDHLAAAQVGTASPAAPGRRERLGLLLVVALHLALVLPLAALLNIWVDEAYTLETTDQGIGHAIARSLGFELQPPLYYVLLTVWRALNDSAFFARLFSVACTAAAIVVTAGLARRYLARLPPVLVAAVIACNPLTVYVAVEARYYALALLLSALLLLKFYDGYLAEQSSAAARRWHALLAIAALYTYYFLGFQLVAEAAVLLALWRRQALRRYLLAMALTAAAFAPQALATLQQMRTVGTIGVTAKHSLLEAVRLVRATFWQQVLPLDRNPALALARTWISRLALPAALVAAVFQRRMPRRELIVALLLASVVSLFFIVIAFGLGPDFLRAQHTVALYVPVLISALALASYAGGARTAVIVAVLSLAFSTAYLREYYRPLAKQGDWIRVAHYIEQNEHAAEPILVFKAEFVLDFGHHYAGLNRLVPIPGPTDRRRYDPTEQVLHGEPDVARPLHRAIGASRHFWIVTGVVTPLRGIDPHAEILEQFVASCCEVLRDERFMASRARLLGLRADFVLPAADLPAAPPAPGAAIGPQRP